jgi:hypothetical protein
MDKRVIIKFHFNDSRGMDRLANKDCCEYQPNEEAGGRK